MRAIWDFQQRPHLRSLLRFFSNLSHVKNVFKLGYLNWLAASHYLLLQNRFDELHCGAFCKPQDSW
jgi:hypothetical protein